ncbi:MAG: hypothetical protein ACLT38_09490 [Akkermansia sp.]
MGHWDFDSTGALDKHGVDRFYGYTDQKACHTYYPPYLWNNGKKEVLNTSLTAATIGHGSQPKGEVLADTYRAEQHSSDLIADKMLDCEGKGPWQTTVFPVLRPAGTPCGYAASSGMD